MLRNVLALLALVGLAQQQVFAGKESERRGRGGSSSTSASLVCIGDSLSDNGNTFKMTGESWPVPKVYPRHAFSNALTWVDYLAATTGKVKSDDDDDDDDDDHHGPGHTRRLEGVFLEALKDVEANLIEKNDDDQHHRFHHRLHHEHESEDERAARKEKWLSRSPDHEQASEEERAARKERWLSRWREHENESEEERAARMEAKWLARWRAHNEHENEEDHAALREKWSRWREHHENESEEERAARKQKWLSRMREHHENESPEEHAARKEKWFSKWRENHENKMTSTSDITTKGHASLRGAVHNEEAANENLMAAVATWRALKSKRKGDDNRKLFSKVYNHAFGGATSDSAFIQGYTGPATSWPVNGGKQQLEMFLLRRSLERRKQDDATTFLIWIGANDFYYRWVSGQSLSDTAFLTGLATNIGNMVTTIAANYNKTSIVVLNAYPLETVPFMQPYLTPDVTGATDKFNTILSDRLTAVQTNLTANVKLIEVDATFVIRQAIKTPPAGVSANSSCVVGDVTTPTVKVCSQPNKFVFYDTFHPTEWIHRVVARAVAAKLA